MPTKPGFPASLQLSSNLIQIRAIDGSADDSARTMRRLAEKPQKRRDTPQDSVKLCSPCRWFAASAAGVSTAAAPFEPSP
ncbi:hypothetical protein [Labrys wisconsinensis]|uniref:Uncharacterized protein n=1 Tax=Labrys wisconsinensis TaxID=425677 RepID=A0ABU0J7Y0_9HYPH|nr:hypothetical protein [Labrys wisconsinensis]MDQ0469710.1 hypothetical protein [Labrys wisconsinensis]